ncbi:putative tRNA pseudouridine synthase Pus10 [Actinomortierella wolfii]|nr:putative tRNA pseudouridine synthase Pus10 [Actinomortierella wolfii]
MDTIEKKRELEPDASVGQDSKKTRLEFGPKSYGASYNEIRESLEKRLGARISTLSQEDRKLVTHLLELSCCGRCVLRMLGVKDYALYELPDVKIRAILKPVVTAGVEAKNTDEDVCTLCVGSVQYAEDFSEAVVERLLKEGYTSKSFNMNVTVPTSTLIRQHAIRVALVDVLGEDISTVVSRTVDIKEIFKLVMSWQVAHRSGMELDFASPLRIQVTLKHTETADDHIFLSGIPESGFKLRFKREKKKQIRIGDGRPNIIAALARVTDARFKEKGVVPPKLVTSKPEIEAIDTQHESVYVGGRYLKFSRDVSQTPWTIGKTKLAELSVSETVAEPVKKAFRADDYKFVTAGREDANVRMLGSGRPFYIELINPHTTSLPEDMYSSLQSQINSTIPNKVQVRKLTWVTPEATKIIKEGEETKTKSYSALCWVSQPVTQALLDRINTFGQQAGKEGFVVDQQTPIRVLQRRAQMIRKKTIYSLRAFAIDEKGQAITTVAAPSSDADMSSTDSMERDDNQSHFLVVHLHTEAGTYIKEFVHGDLGRNQPNLGAIAGCEADIMELDVLDVDLEFPPPRN